MTAATAEGQDIYAITAPLVAEALERVLDGRTRSVGVVSAGEIFDASDFLHALAPHITVNACRLRRHDLPGRFVQCDRGHAGRRTLG